MIEDGRFTYIEDPLTLHAISLTAENIRNVYSYADLDATEGRFSLFAELHVQHQRIKGYVKPFFKDIEVYSARQEREETLFQKLYEGVVDGVADILKNESSERVATKSDISGPIEDPEADTWQVIANLIENAFFDVILPGFEMDGGAPDAGDEEEDSGSAPRGS